MTSLPVTSNEWLYFGCHREAGHYLFRQGMLPLYGRQFDRLMHMDGKLPPQASPAPYIASFSRLGGWGLSALAFWDYSVDKRDGSNSVIFAPSLTITAQDMLDEAAIRFPDVFKRLPQAVTLQHASGVQDGSPAMSQQRNEGGK